MSFRGATDEMRLNACEMSQVYPIKLVALRFGVTPETIRRWRKQHGFRTTNRQAHRRRRTIPRAE